MEQFARFPYVLVYAVVGVVFLFIGKLIYDLFTRYKLDAELTKEDNPAVGTAVLGYLVALIIIIARLIPEVGYDKLPKDSRMDTLVSDVINLAIYSFLGVVLLNFSRIIVDKLILFKFKINKELIDDKNVGTAAVLAGSYIASGLVIAGCLAGDIKPEMLQKAFNQSFSPLVSGLLLSLIFFMVGQLTLVLYSFVYSWVAPYNVHEQIEEDNVAAGIAFGGGLVALGIILYRGIHGNGQFYGWIDSLTYYGWLVVFAIVAFPLVRWIVSLIMMPGASLTKEIKEDRNVNAAFLEIACLNMVAGIVLYAY